MEGSKSEEEVSVLDIARRREHGSPHFAICPPAVLAIPVVSDITK